MSENKEKIKYSSIVSSIVEERLYFKDSLDWYFLKYINPISEKTYFIILSVLSFIILFFLYFTINNILPLKESFPVLIRQKDSATYYTKIDSIKPKGLNYNSNQAILRFLIINYSRELFNHDYRKGDINDLNNKLLRIRNYSSDEVYNKFREEFNKISSNMFNKNVVQTVSIRTFKFIEEKKDTKSKIKDYIFTSIPTSAEVTYIRYFNDGSNVTKTNGTIIFSFKFDPIKYNNIKKEFTKPTLVITNYTIKENNV